MPHLLFAFPLLVEQLAFARGVAAVAFGGDVLAEGAHGLAGDDLAADGVTGSASNQETALPPCTKSRLQRARKR